MSDLLTSVLAATESARQPVIVSENHDTGSINWVSGLSDPGEMISCGYLPEIRRQEGEQDTEYAARIRPIVMALPQEQRDRIMGSAIQRASLDDSTGRVSVMVAGVPAWHGLGVNVREAVTSEQAIRLAGLNWAVNKTQLQFKHPVSGEMVNAEDTFGVVRGDTGKMLGVVGKVYKPIQNVEGFDFLDALIGEFDARYETAGAIYGGSQVWMLVHLPKQSFTVNGEDRVEPYCIFTNSHDGKSAARCFPTTQRVVCANTFRLAKSDRDKGITLRHTGNLKGKIESARQAIGLAVQEVAEFKRTAEEMATTKLEPLPYFNGLLDTVCEVTLADVIKGCDALAATLKVTEADRMVEAARIQREIDKRKNLLDDLLERYESDTNGIGGMRGTAWSGFNAVTESANHGALGGRYRGEDKASRRFENVLNGGADNVMQDAFELVKAFVN